MVKLRARPCSSRVIDVDLDRRRISLSLKQANDSVDPASEDFDPAIYGMPAEYDEQGNYKYPEGFDPNTNGVDRWLRSSARSESQYAAAHELWEEHKEFVAKGWRTLPNPQPPTARAQGREAGRGPQLLFRCSDYRYPRRLRSARRPARPAARQVSLPRS